MLDAVSLHKRTDCCSHVEMYSYESDHRHMGQVLCNVQVEKVCKSLGKSIKTDWDKHPLCPINETRLEVRGRAVSAY